MSERASSVGGSLHAGPRPEGGFLVEAWLPTGRAVVTDSTPVAVMMPDDQRRDRR